MVEAVAHDRPVERDRTRSSVAGEKHCKFAVEVVRMIADSGCIAADYGTEADRTVAESEQSVVDYSRKSWGRYVVESELGSAELVEVLEAVVCSGSPEEEGCKVGGWKKHRDVIGVDWVGWVRGVVAETREAEQPGKYQ